VLHYEQKAKERYYVRSRWILFRPLWKQNTVILARKLFPVPRIQREAAILKDTIYIAVGQDASVGIATGYGMDSPGIKSPFGRVFHILSILALRPT
jgi:hypothetical protein